MCLHVHKYIAVCTHAYGLSVSGAGVELTNRGRNKSQIHPRKKKKKLTRGESILLKQSHFAAADFLFGGVVPLPPSFFISQSWCCAEPCAFSRCSDVAVFRPIPFCHNPSLSPHIITSSPASRQRPGSPPSPGLARGCCSHLPNCAVEVSCRMSPTPG